jgi:hypothetical protein
MGLFQDDDEGLAFVVVLLYCLNFRFVKWLDVGA